MLSLRSARGRAILAGVVLVVVLAGIATVAGWRARDARDRNDRLAHTSAVATALEHARAQLFLEAAATSALMFIEDPALAERSRLAAVELRQDLSQARAEMMASGKADDLAALDGLSEQIDAIEAQIDAAMPFFLAGDQETILALASTRWPELWPTIVATMSGLETLARAEESELAAHVAAADRAADTSFWLVIGLSALALAVTAGAAVVIASVVRPLAALRASARAVTSGDLAARAKVAGPAEVASLAHDFNAMTDALAAMTEEYVTTANLTGDIIVKVGKDDRVTFLNDAACELFGGAREELLGVEYADYVHPEDVEPTAQIIREAAARRELVRGFVSRVITPVGTRVVEWNGCSLFDEQGQYAGFQVTGRDITDRKLAEEALRQSEARYRLLAENATDVIWTMDTNLRVTYVSPSVTRLRGYTVEEAMAQTLAETLTPASLEVAMRAVAEEWAIEKMDDKDLARWRTLEVENTCKDGSTVWFEVKIAFLHDEDKRPVGIVGVSRDISKRKRAEEALRESEEGYRAIFEQAADSILLIDAETGALVQFNDRAHEILGYTREEFEKLKIPDFDATESAEEVARHIERIVKEGADIFETRHRTKSGEMRDIEVRKRAISIRGRDFIQTIFHDISERKRAQEALQKVRDELESRVERRMQQVNGYRLTFRELTVLHLVAAGESDKEIATVLGISPLTAHKHLANILEKMGAACRTEAGVRALREGLLD